MAKNNILRWVGSKTHAVDLLKKKLKDCKETNLYEFYCGSSILSIELNKFFVFEKSVCIDLDYNVINFYNYLKQNLNDLIKYYENNWNKLKENSDHYYKIREKFNKNKESHDWFFLNRTCINGMMRYNKEKFNSPLHLRRNGTKPKSIEKILKNNINSVIKIDFIFDDVLKYLETNTIENSIIILDPPYFKTGLGLYKEPADENKLIKILEKIYHNNKVILFYGSQFDDRSNMLLDKFKFNVQKIGLTKNAGSFFRKMQNDKTKVEELVYFNF